MKNYKVTFVAQKKVELQECDMPVIGDDDMLIKTEVSQISTGTELTLLEGNVEEGSDWERFIKYPSTPGYSNVGRVIEVGKNVPRDMIGKKILSFAKHQMYHRLSYNEYYKMLVPETVSSDGAAFGVISEIVQGSIRAAEVGPGSSCVVYGAGLIGQLAARLAKAAGATKIFVCDVSDLRLSKVPENPCYITINTKNESARDVIMKYTENKGADIVFETTSCQQLADEEMRCLGECGKLVITSSPKGKSLIDLNYCNTMGIIIIGGHANVTHTPCEIPGKLWTKKKDADYFIELLDKKEITVEEMITHTPNYKDAAAAYEMLMKDRTQALAVNIRWED